MKTSETQAVTLLIFALSTCTWAILSGNDPLDISEDHRFGCESHGGANPGIRCRCLDPTAELYIAPKSISSYDTSTIEISSCSSVRFGSNSIEQMRNLRSITLSNIKSLHFEPSSLTWYGTRDRNDYQTAIDLSIPSLRINIDHSNITHISSHTFEGRLNTIIFSNVTIQSMEPFAFTSLVQTQNIIFRNTHLENLRFQAFKKITTENLVLDGISADQIPSKFFFDVAITGSVTITNCVFASVRPGGFAFLNPTRFEVTNTKIGQLDGEAFKVSTTRDVLFRNNTFKVINDGAFRAITNPQEGSEPTITFDSNVFASLTRDSLGVDESFRVKFLNLFTNETCDCKNINHKIQDDAFYNEIKCQWEGEFVTVREYTSNECSIIQGYSTLIVVVGVVFTLCVIVGTLLVLYYKKLHLRRKYGSEEPKKGNVSLIVPDGRTYRETELHVIVERADLLTTDL